MCTRKVPFNSIFIKRIVTNDSANGSARVQKYRRSFRQLIFSLSFGVGCGSVWGMKLTVLILFAFSTVVSTVSAAQAWVDGVSQSSGWYDANKENPNAADGDNDLCWAASASNLIAWWQDKYRTPADVPDGVDSIWATYKNAATDDTGGDIHAAFQWWLTGVYVPTNDEEDARSIFAQASTSVLPAFEGYYYEEYGEEMMRLWPNFELERWEYSLESFFCINDRAPVTSENIISLVLQGCGMGLGLAQDNNAGFGHAITLWGIEYDDSTHDISRLWLTDSDDKQYNFGQDGLFMVDVTTRDNKLYIDTPDSNWYSEEEDIYISHLFAINPEVSTAWGIPLAVPEPSTATLSLLGLTALLARRRRK